MAATKNQTTSCKALSKDKRAALLSMAKTKPEYVVEDKPVTDDEVDRFLGYECKYKRHLGQTWLWVLQNDYQYLQYIVKNVMQKSTRTYKVLSTLV